MTTEEMIGNVIKGLSTDLGMTLNYYHGSPLAISNTLAKIKLGESKYPCVVLFDEFEESIEPDPLSLFERSATLSLFFMNICKKEWTIEEHIANAVSAMNIVVDLFREAIDTSKYFGRIESMIKINRTSWGLYLQNENGKKPVFPDLLSGVELRVTLPVKKAFC